MRREEMRGEEKRKGDEKLENGEEGKSQKFRKRERRK